jgi:hypothetical protein
VLGRGKPLGPLEALVLVLLMMAAGLAFLLVLLLFVEDKQIVVTAMGVLAGVIATIAGSMTALALRKGNGNGSRDGDG